MSRDVSLDDSGGSLVLAIHDKGGVGGMDCESVNRDTITLSLDASSSRVDFEGYGLGRLHCVRSWH